MNEKIDFVIIWVDGNDKKWQEDKNKYSTQKIDLSNSENRYRDWENLQYWFRGVEKFAPWVNKIHFVTYGHLPKWLNVNHPKLNIVKHSDYIPEEYLPTFSANPIEINLHRIKDLSENFVFFNDDLFITDFIKESDFFINGKPLGILSENAIISTSDDDVFSHFLLNDVGIINKNFDKKDVLKRNFSKWFNLKNCKGVIKTVKLLPWKKFTGLEYSHLANSFKKSTLKEVWDKEYEIMDVTSKNKFRSKYDVNQYVFQYWQLAKGDFMPRKSKLGECFELSNNNIDDVCKLIEKQTYKIMCVNDSNMDIDFETAKSKVKESLDKILPNKSEFEI